MKKSVLFHGILVGALAITSLCCVSANADSRHRDESSWRESRRDSRNDRDFLSGVVERVDQRRGVALVRVRNHERLVAVEMEGHRNRRAGVDFADLRRGDYVTFVGDWSRGGVFEARRIDSVDSRRGRGRW
jgi:hypothetical protein